MRSVAMVVLLLATASLGAQVPSIPLHLVHCADGSNAACLEAAFRLDGRVTGELEQADSLAESRGWSGDLAGLRLLGPGVVSSSSISPPSRLFLLIDRSSTMAGEPWTFARAALKSFLRELDPVSVRVAVAGFESHGVLAAVAQTRFLPPAEASESLDAMVAPSRHGNRALYSAVTSAVTRLAAALQLEPGVSGRVIVMTNGRNVVDERRDDRALLSGPTGASTARHALEEAGVPVSVITMREPEGDAELGEMLGSLGTVSSATVDPNDLSRQLGAISRTLHLDRTLTFGFASTATIALPRTAWNGNAVLWVDGRPMLHAALSWRPPLFAQPRFDGVATPTPASLSLRTALADEADGPSPRTLVTILLVMTVMGMWIFVPRVIWMSRIDPADAGPHPVATPSQRAAALGDARLQGRQIGEAEPRKPDEITQETPRVRRIRQLALVLALGSMMHPSLSPGQRPGGRTSPPTSAPQVQEPHQSEKETLLRFCLQTDTTSPHTLEGVRLRTDCWKRMQLQGMGDSTVDLHYQAAIDDYVATARADSTRAAGDSNLANIGARVAEIQKAIQESRLDDAEQDIAAVLAVQPENQRVLVFRERLAVLKRQHRTRTVLFSVAGSVILVGLGLGVLSRSLARRHDRRLEALRVAAASRQAMVEIVDGIGRGKIYSVDGPIFRIGSAISERSEERNDLVLSDDAAFISRNHCSIVCKDGRYFLIDSSLNGTYLGDELLERGEHRPLDDGAEFSIAGMARFKFLMVQGSAPDRSP